MLRSIFDKKLFYLAKVSPVRAFLFVHTAPVTSNSVTKVVSFYFFSCRYESGVKKRIATEYQHPLGELGKSEQRLQHHLKNPSEVKGAHLASVCNATLTRLV